MIRHKTVLITLFLFGLFAVRLSAGDAMGVVRDLHGNANRVSPTVAEPLKLGSPVYSQDKIRTDMKSFVVITLENASTIAVGPNTELVIDPWLAAQHSDLEIVSGQIGFEADDRANANVETIRTVFGMIGVRG